MKARKWTITLHRHEENLCGLRCGRDLKTFNHSHAFAPTVDNVKRAIRQLFPGYVPNETYWTIKEQISDSLECGYFSIDVLNINDPGEEFCGYCVGFMEA